MRLLCFGDSNTYGFDPRSHFGDRYPEENRWVDLLARKTGWEIINAGENGREIPRRSYELQEWSHTLSACMPLDILVVMLGSNDLLQGTDAAEAAARMDRFLAQLPIGHKQILLVAPPPMKPGAWVPDEHLINASSELAQQYRTLAQQLGVFFADAGCWKVSLTFDGVHFSEAGHQAFAEGIYASLTSIKAEFEAAKSDK